MYQGSLKKCLLQAAHLFAHNRNEQIAIMRYPRSKSYKVYTEIELRNVLQTERDYGQQIIVNCKAREFTTLTRSDQYSLFPEATNGEQA